MILECPVSRKGPQGRPFESDQLLRLVERSTRGLWCDSPEAACEEGGLTPPPRIAKTGFLKEALDPAQDLRLVDAVGVACAGAVLSQRAGSAYRSRASWRLPTTRRARKQLARQR